jgi:hypothetical protein
VWLPGHPRQCQTCCFRVLAISPWFYASNKFRRAVINPIRATTVLQHCHLDLWEINNFNFHRFCSWKVIFGTRRCQFSQSGCCRNDAGFFQTRFEARLPGNLNRARNLNHF